MRCLGSVKKHRNAKPHGSHSHGASKEDYKHGMRGHKWTGHGKDRHCDKCGVKPRHLYGSKRLPKTDEEWYDYWFLQPNKSDNYPYIKLG